MAELNTKFTDIVQEAESHAAENDTPSESRQIGVAVPRYHRARLLGQRPVAELATRYLTEASERLRPSSYKSVRFALELLVSHAGDAQSRDLSQALGREGLGEGGGRIRRFKVSFLGLASHRLFSGSFLASGCF